MSTYRIERLNSLIRNEISQIFFEEVKNPMFEKVTITSVRVSADLSLAVAFYSTFDGEARGLEKPLNDAAGFIRGLLKKRLRLKKIPEIRFKYDTSIEYGEHIEKILKDISNENG